MTQRKPGFDEKMVRNATWGAVLLTAAGLLFVVVGFAIAEINSWKDYILLGAPAVLFLLGLVSLVVLRRGEIVLGTGLIFVANLILPLVEVGLQRGIGLAAIGYTVISSILLIWRSLPGSSRRWASIMTGMTVIALIVIELVNSPIRINPADELVAFIVISTALLTVSFVYQAVRQTWGQSMRNKLLVAFIGVTLVAAGTLAAYVFISTSTILRQGLERELTEHTDGVASDIGALINEQINTTTTLSLNEILQQSAERANHAYRGDTIAIQTTLGVRDAQWRSADAAGNDNDPLVSENLSNQAALELKEFQRAFPNHAEIFITDVYGGLAGATNRTSDYYQADEDWWQVAYNNGQGGVYISDPEFDESAGALAIQIAVPLRNRETGEIVGILRTTYSATAIGTILDEPVGKTGMADLYIPGEVVSHFHGGQLEVIEPEQYEKLLSVAGQGMVEMNYEDAPSIVLQVPVQSQGGNPAVNNLGWVVAFHQDQEEAISPINTQIRGALVVMAVVVILAVAAAFVLSIFLVRPIIQLTKTAEEVASGDLNRRAEVTTSDEIGTLASTFNSMTSQLQETLQGLEQRVAARTRDLEIVAEVGTATATILESKRLLQEVVELTKERFNLYHSHIYLLDEKGENLVLTAGAGEPGRVMVAEGRSIPLAREQSLVARAARERKGVTVNDVTKAPDFLPNPLLPDTRSELAVPMIVGGKVIGVFDIQAEIVGRFTDADVNIQTTMAAQLATSVQNVRSFEQSKKQAELESIANVIGQRIQRTTSIEETLQTAIRELGTAIGASRVSAKVSRREDNENPVLSK